MPKQPKQPEPEPAPERTPEEIAAYESHERIVAGIDGGRMILAGAGDGHRADRETRVREEARWLALTPEQRLAEERESFEKWNAIWKKQHPECFDKNGVWKGVRRGKRAV